MSSLEMVEFINSQRGECEPPLQHRNFMAKVPVVLGDEGVLKFKHTYVHPQNGQVYPCYQFPKREACLMAMSYSYELQAKVFDRMTELEQGKPTPPLAIPQSLPEALRLAADLAEQNGKQALLIEQQKPASVSQFHPLTPMLSLCGNFGGPFAAIPHTRESARQVREYLIECEKRLISSVPAIPQSLPEALRLAADLADPFEALLSA